MFFFYTFYIYTCVFILMNKKIKTRKMNCKYVSEHRTLYMSPFFCQQINNKIRQCSVALVCTLYHDQSHSSLHALFMTVQYVFS